MRRTDKLPIWAQELINSQARQINDLQRALRTIQGETGGGLEIGRSPIDMMKPLLRMPVTTHVRFAADDATPGEWVIEARLEGDALLLYGADSLIICPTASNCASIKVRGS